VRNLEPSLLDRIGTLPGTGATSLSIRPAWGEPAANLLLAAEEGDFDLLIVGSEQRHGLSRIWRPSTARRLIKRALTVPVVCVPAGGRVSPVGELPELPRFSVVLVPTDLSRVGNAAVPYAYALLGDRGGVIELCHIHTRPLPNPPYSYEQPRDRLTPQQVSGLQAQLRALVPPSAEQRGITTHISVIEGGPPAEAIVQASERLGVDVISMGSHGAGALARVVLGSVAEGVVRTSRKPVLVVRSSPP
jgi:nucleotide-binding universal stress UspA family protein